MNSSEQFHLNEKTVSPRFTLPSDLSCRGFFFCRGDTGVFPGGGLSLQLRIIQETPCFVSSYDPLEERRIIVSTIDQVTTNRHAIIKLVLRQDARYTTV